MYVEVILNLPVNQGFTYTFSPSQDSKKEENLPQIGKRAEIMFGNKKTTGFIIGISEEKPQSCPVDDSKIKAVRKIIDKEPLFCQELINLARWISHYYLCTLGEAIFAMLPSGRRESGTAGFSFEGDIVASKKNILSEEQEKAVQDILSDKENNYHYLYGPTGSGKTEVFLQLAEKTLEENKGVIYLVPEISLTEQVTTSLIERFGKTVAVIHSQLTPSQKLNQWNKIMHKECRVVIGARSAVFAPMPDLGLIIIDEEHDASYKSGNNPRYHARQVAMHRASELKIPLVMGSATPSVEAWKGMEDKIIHKHCLTKRLAGGSMPHIHCINLNNYDNENCISKPLEDEINKTLRENKQVILFLNRRGFTHFFRCNTCGYELECKNCSIPLTYHKVQNRLRCHYCGYSVSPPQVCPECGSLDVGYSGFGTEFIETEVKAKFPNARVVRVDTDSLNHKGELTEKLDAFKKGEYDIMLGTQMVAKGLNFPNLKLVGVVLADTGLHMPDFRAAERTFALITQVAGRAGRFFPDGKVLVQTYCPDSEPIAYAVAGKTEEFYESEIKIREMLNFPPFARILRMVFRAPSEHQAVAGANGAAAILQKILYGSKANPSKLQEAACQTEILGPAECPLSKIAANYRQQIILRGPSIGLLQYMASTFMANFKAPGEVYIEYDVDPVSLL